MPAAVLSSGVSVLTSSSPCRLPQRKREPQSAQALPPGPRSCCGVPSAESDEEISTWQRDVSIEVAQQLGLASLAQQHAWRDMLSQAHRAERGSGSARQ